MSWSGTVRCGHCYERGHNKRSCPSLKERMQQRLAANPDDWRATEYFKKNKAGKVRRCTYCNLKGHNRRTCVNLSGDIATYRQKAKDWRNGWAEWMAEIGLTVGSLVEVNTGYSSKNIRLVKGFKYLALNHEANEGDYPHQSVAVVRPSDLLGNHGTRCHRLPQHGELTPQSSEYMAVVGPVKTTKEAILALAPDWFADASEDLSDVFDKDRKHKDFWDNEYSE